jgi:uncharacterized membrane protein YgcG
MRELLFGSWGPEAIAYTKQNPLKVAAVAINAIAIVLTLLFGKFSSSGGGDDYGGFGFGDGDSGGGD